MFGRSLAVLKTKLFIWTRLTHTITQQHLQVRSCCFYSQEYVRDLRQGSVSRKLVRETRVLKRFPFIK